MQGDNACDFELGRKITGTEGFVDNICQKRRDYIAYIFEDPRGIGVDIGRFVFHIFYNQMYLVSSTRSKKEII